MWDRRYFTRLGMTSRSRVTTASISAPRNFRLARLTTSRLVTMKIVSSSRSRFCRKVSPVEVVNAVTPVRIEGQKTVGIEIAQQFDWESPEVIIIPGGNLGNVSALGKGLMMMPLFGSQDSATQINIIFNFLTELRQRVR